MFVFLPNVNWSDFQVEFFLKNRHGQKKEEEYLFWRMGKEIRSVELSFFEQKKSINNAFLEKNQIKQNNRQSIIIIDFFFAKGVVHHTHV